MIKPPLFCLVFCRKHTSRVTEQRSVTLFICSHCVINLFEYSSELIISWLWSWSALSEVQNQVNLYFLGYVFTFTKMSIIYTIVIQFTPVDQTGTRGYHWALNINQLPFNLPFCYFTSITFCTMITWHVPDFICISS